MEIKDKINQELSENPFRVKFGELSDKARELQFILRFNRIKQLRANLNDLTIILNR